MRRTQGSRRLHAHALATAGGVGGVRDERRQVLLDQEVHGLPALLVVVARQQHGLRLRRAARRLGRCLQPAQRLRHLQTHHGRERGLRSRLGLHRLRWRIVRRVGTRRRGSIRRWRSRHVGLELDRMAGERDLVHDEVGEAQLGDRQEAGTGRQELRDPQRGLALARDCHAREERGRACQHSAHAKNTDTIVHGKRRNQRPKGRLQGAVWVPRRLIVCNHAHTCGGSQGDSRMGLKAAQALTNRSRAAQKAGCSLMASRYSGSVHSSMNRSMRS